MIENFIIVLNQIIILGFLIGVGFFVRRKEIVTFVGSQDFSNLLIYLISPTIIINSFNRELDKNIIPVLLQSFIVSIILYLVSIVISRIFTKKMGFLKNSKSDIASCLSFPNSAFMAIPLINALFGRDSILIATPNLVVFAIFLWTYGIHIFTKERQVNWKKIFLNPGILAFVTGTCILLLPFKLPWQISKVLEQISSLNTPIGMLVLGMYLSEVQFKSISFKDNTLVIVSLIRLTFIPIVTGIVLLLLPISPVIRLPLFVCMAGPAAITNAVISKLFGGDYLYSSKIIVISTLLSMVTMPILISIFMTLAG